MAMCPTCGRRVDGGAAYCPYCGHMLEQGIAPGTVLEARYRIEALIGEGGIGRVYRAVDEERGQPVAIKALLARWASNAEQVARFRREAAALALLRHPAIVELVDVGSHRGTPFLVMELLRGHDLLSEVIVDGKAMAFERVVRVIEQVLAGLDAAHGAGVIHRDLKPENVMILDAAPGAPADRVKLLDFGIALLAPQDPTQRLTRTGELRGTPLYMAPEQFRNKDVGPATDVYAVGVMLFELLAGEPPFVGPSTAELMAQHLHAPVPAVRDRGVRRAVPPELERLARLAMAKRVADRPTAAALREALVVGGMIEIAERPAHGEGVGAVGRLPADSSAYDALTVEGRDLRRP